MDNINVNVDFGNTGGENSVIFADETGVITGLNNKMHLLAASPKFSPDRIPAYLRKDFYNLPNVSFSTGDPFGNKSNEKYIIPDWLMKMHKLRYLLLEDVKLNGLSFLADVKLEQLLLFKIKLENKDDVLNDISKLVNLQYLVTDTLFTPQDILFLKGRLPDLIVLTKIEYIKKFENEEISMPK